MTQFLEQLMQLLADTSYIAFAAPLVVIVVALLKRVPQLANVDAAGMSLGVQVVVWLAYLVADHLGGGAQFQAWTEAGASIAQILLPLLMSEFASKGIYSLAKQTGVAVIGYERT